jgi:GMP synthase PP-ATPase subunit
MTDDQVYDFVKESGTIVYDQIKDNKEYYENLFSTLDQEQKQKIIQKLFQRARKAAKGIVYTKTLG